MGEFNMINAVLFDMDGVLVDSEELTYTAAIEMLKERGADACKEDFIPFIGAGDIAYLGGAAGRHGLTYDKEMSGLRKRGYILIDSDGDIVLPMDEALILAALDISGRGMLCFRAAFRAKKMEPSGQFLLSVVTCGCCRYMPYNSSMFMFVWCSLFRFTPQS